MKTKYEKFLQHLIYGLDEPKKTFMTHHGIGFHKDPFSLKGKLLSATKIFLSDDFMNKDLPKWNREEMKRADKEIDTTYICNACGGSGHSGARTKS